MRPLFLCYPSTSSTSSFLSIFFFFCHPNIERYKLCSHEVSLVSTYVYTNLCEWDTITNLILHLGKQMIAGGFDSIIFFLECTFLFIYFVFFVCVFCVCFLFFFQSPVLSQSSTAANQKRTQRIWRPGFFVFYFFVFFRLPSQLCVPQKRLAIPWSVERRKNSLETRGHVV